MLRSRFFIAQTSTTTTFNRSPQRIVALLHQGLRPSASDSSAQQQQTPRERTQPLHPTNDPNFQKATGKDYQSLYASHSSSTVPKILLFPLIMYFCSIIFEWLLEISPFSREGDRPGWKRATGGSLVNIFTFGRRGEVEVPKHGEQQLFLKRRKERELAEEEKKRKNE